MSDAKREALAALTDALITVHRPLEQQDALECTAHFRGEHSAREALDDLFANAAQYMPKAMAKLGRCPVIEVRELERLRDEDILTRARVDAAIDRAREKMASQEGMLAVVLAELEAEEASCRDGEVRLTYGVDAVSQAVGVNRAIRILRRHVSGLQTLAEWKVGA